MLRLQATLFLCLATPGLGQMLSFSSHSFSSSISFASDEDGTMHQEVREVHGSSVGDGLVEHQTQSKMACKDGRCIQAVGKRTVPLLARPRSPVMEITSLLRQPRVGRSQMPAMRLMPLLSRPRLSPELSLLSRSASIMDQLADQNLGEGRVVESVPLLQVPFMSVLQELAQDDSETDEQPEMELLVGEQQAGDEVPPPKLEQRHEPVSHENQALPITQSAQKEKQGPAAVATPKEPSQKEKPVPAVPTPPKAQAEELASSDKKSSYGDFFNFVKDMVLPESKPEMKKEPDHAGREESMFTDV